MNTHFLNLGIHILRVETAVISDSRFHIHYTHGHFYILHRYFTFYYTSGLGIPWIRYCICTLCREGLGKTFPRSFHTSILCVRWVESKCDCETERKEISLFLGWIYFFLGGEKEIHSFISIESYINILTHQPLCMDYFLSPQKLTCKSIKEIYIYLYLLYVPFIQLAFSFLGEAQYFHFHTSNTFDI